MRSGQPFSLRYPLIEVEGSYGNLIESGNWAAPRYTSSRLSELSNYLFSSIEKDTIEDWRNNYDDTEEYPSVLPSFGFYNIVNGTIGIGVALSSSIPCFNLVDVNNAMIKLLWNPDIADEELICMPDFPTGAFILNEAEVKESLIHGQGKSIKLRSLIEYDEKENCLIVKEIPYSVYTNTICHQLETLIEKSPSCGIIRFNDLTGEKPLIKIYLSKGAKPERVLRILYKETSLQSHFAINFTMLDQGRYPKVFTWKEALSAHIEHEKICYRRAFEFDLNKIKNRLNIIEGLLIAIDSIDEVIKIIKSSSDSNEAAKLLIAKLNINQEQATAILNIKLSRLAHLEIEKLQKEQNQLLNEKNRIENILVDTKLFYNEIEKGFKAVIEKFGDEHRTKLMNIESDDEEIPVEHKILNAFITNKNNIYLQGQSSLLISSRNKPSKKLKLSDEEVIVFSGIANNDSPLIGITNFGRAIRINIDKFPINQKSSIEDYIKLKDNENIIYFTLIDSNPLVFITKNGYGKRLSMRELKTLRSAATVITFKDDDSITYVSQCHDNNDIIVFSTGGHAVRFPVNELPLLGRTTRGVVVQKLDKEKTCSAILINSASKSIVTLTENGLIKKTLLNEFPVGSRGNKGVIAHKLNDKDKLAAAAILNDDISTISIFTQNGILKISQNEIPLRERNASGNKAIKLKPNEKIRGIL